MCALHHLRARTDEHDLKLYKIIWKWLYNARRKVLFAILQKNVRSSCFEPTTFGKTRLKLNSLWNNIENTSRIFVNKTIFAHRRCWTSDSIEFHFANIALNSPSWEQASFDLAWSMRWLFHYLNHIIMIERAKTYNIVNIRPPLQSMCKFVCFFLSSRHLVGLVIRSILLCFHIAPSVGCMRWNHSSANLVLAPISFSLFCNPPLAFNMIECSINI